MGLWSRIKRTLVSGAHDAEIREELEFHLDMDTSRGIDPRDARLRLGNTSRIAEETRAAGIVEWLESIMQDVRHGLRQMRKSPALSLAIVLSLAVGIGANTAIFALADAVLLKPLPVRDPDELMVLEWRSQGNPTFVQRSSGRRSTVEGGQTQITAVSEAVYRTFVAGQSVFDAVIGFSVPRGMSISDGGNAEQVRVQYVSLNFFSALGVSPSLGRSFLEEEDRRGQVPAVVVSQRYWTGRLGSDPNAIGRTIRVNNAPARIVGVAPPAFFGLAIGEWVDAYAPLSARVAFEAAQVARPPPGGENADWWVQQIVRRKPGSSLQAALLQAAPLFRGAAAETTGTELRNDLTLIATPGQRGVETLIDDENTGIALRVLTLLVGVLLLIVCANVANLLLSRAVGQQRESAVRLALGAARWRLFRQNLVASGMLALFGGAAGIAIASALASAIHALFQSGQNSGSAYDLSLDWRMLAYTTLLSAITALLFGLAPAVRAARSDVNDSLKANARSVTGGRLRLPRLLVSLQLALCLAALVAAGLLGRSLGKLYAVDLGFAPEHLAYATVNPSQAGYKAEQIADYIDRLQRGLEAIPSVSGVAVLDNRPLQGGSRFGFAFSAEGPQALPDGRPNPASMVNMGSGSAGFLETLGVRILAGRALDARDRDAVVVDERTAQVYFKGRNPVGDRLTMMGRSMEVVGLAAQARVLQVREDEPSAPTVYLLFDPARFVAGQVHFAIRSPLETEQLAAEVRRVVASVDRSVPLTEFHTQTGLIDRQLRTERLLAFLSGGFGLLALTLAAIGLGGLLVYAVARRTNEIGIRVALGASSGRVTSLVLRDSVWMIAVGVVIGAPGVYFTGRYLQSLLYDLPALDRVTTALALGSLVAVAMLASWIPARRAARIDPMRALREE